MASGRCPATEAPRLRGRLETVEPGIRDISGPLRSEAQRAIALGVLLEGRIHEAWVLACLRQALSVPGVCVAVIAVARANPRASIASRLHRVLDWVDTQLRCRNERLFVPGDVTAEFTAPLVEIETGSSKDGWYPTEAGVATLRRREADVWLCFSATPPRRPFPAVSRYGVWGLEIGPGIPAAHRWAGANEIGGGSPVTMVSITDYAQSADGALYRSFGATIRNSISRNRLGCLCKGTSFFQRLLERLSRNRGAWHSAPPPPPHYPAQREPTVSALTRLSWRLASKVAANRLRSLRRPEQWQVAYYFADECGTEFQFERLRYLAPPEGHFWADPFAVEHQGRNFIFFEELPFRTRKGRIMAVEVFEHAAPGGPQAVLERPYHLSYPFLFTWGGSLYMLPETAENRTIEIYRCEEFPSRWRLHQVLLDNLSAYDATLWRGDDRWWMFVNVAEPGADSSDELHLYWSPTPFGPWTAHRNNPVVSDVRCARPAGPLFARDGALYRPSQDCSRAYGHSVLINRVDVLDDDQYRETTMQRILPGWRRDILCAHTLGGCGRLRVVDCLVSRKRW